MKSVNGCPPIFTCTTSVSDEIATCAAAGVGVAPMPRHPTATRNGSKEKENDDDNDSDERGNGGRSLTGRVCFLPPPKVNPCASGRDCGLAPVSRMAGVLGGQGVRKAVAEGPTTPARQR